MEMGGAGQTTEPEHHVVEGASENKVRVIRSTSLLQTYAEKELRRKFEVGASCYLQRIFICGHGERDATEKKITYNTV
jgi:hypothetical protein